MKFLVRRLIFSFFAWMALLAFTFILIRIYPGGPFDEDINYAPQVIESLNKQYGLTLPLYEQMFLYFKNICSLNFGMSILYPGRTIAEVVSLAWPRSFSIGIMTLIISCVLGFFLGIRYYLSHSANLVKLLHYTFLSAPSLFLGPFFILIFGLWLNLLPISVNASYFSYILPLLVMCVRPTANIARLLMTGLEESLSQRWVITSQAYGYSAKRILYKYALKQSLIPVLAYLSQSAAGILSGSILIEVMFNVQGLGTLFVDSLMNRDYALVTSLTGIYGSLLIVSGFFFDFLSYLLDPRMERS